MSAPATVRPPVTEPVTVGTGRVVPQPAEAAAFAGFDIVPLRVTVRIDGVAPAEALRRLCAAAESTGSAECGFLLESASQDGVGRWSYVGHRPRPLPTGDDPVPALSALAGRSVAPVPGLPPFHGGAVGYLGYETVRHFEPRVPPAGGPGPDLPESAFLAADDLVVFDHATGEVQLLTAHRPGAEDHDTAVTRLRAMYAALCAQPRRGPDPMSRSGDDWEANTTREEFLERVRRAREHIAAGDVFQVVLSQRFTRRLGSSPLELYRALRATNPSPYLFLLCLGGGRYVIGASPELLVRTDDRRVRTRPLAGTRPRGADPRSDARRETELLADVKERAEHVMLVDLGRHDIGRVAAPGSVRVDALMDVERYSHVMHLSSTVSGELAEGRTGVDALRAAFPAGTLSGAPKIRAMEIVAELEGERRGVYGGALGTVGHGGAVDMAIVLRTFVVEGGRVHVQAGAGVVSSSDPDAEYAETLHKAAALFVAVERAEDIR